MLSHAARLGSVMAAAVPPREPYQPSPRAESFLGTLDNGRYHRQIIAGLTKFLDGTAPEEMRALYTPAQSSSRLRGDAGGKLQRNALDRHDGARDQQVGCGGLRGAECDILIDSCGDVRIILPYN